MMVRIHSFSKTNNDNCLFHFFFLGKVTWAEYAALYIKFHHMNTTDIKDLNDVDFVQESFDNNRKYNSLC